MSALSAQHGNSVHIDNALYELQKKIQEIIPVDASDVHVKVEMSISPTGVWYFISVNQFHAITNDFIFTAKSRTIDEHIPEILDRLAKHFSKR